MARLTGPLVGAPGDSTRRTTTPEFPLGSVVRGPAGEYTYVKAGASIAQYDAVKFNGSTLGFDDVRPTAAVNELVLGVADAAFASGEYGFIQTGGICTSKVTNSTAVGSVLVSSATAGTLKLATEAESLAGNRGAVALTTGASSATAGAVVYLN